MDPSSGFTGTPAAVKSCAKVGGAAEFIASETFWFRFRCCSPVVLVVVFVDTFFPAPPPFAADEGVIITSLTYTRISIISLSYSPATTKRFFSLNTLDDARNKVKRTTRETTILLPTKTLSLSLNRPRKRVSLSRRKRRQFFPITTLANVCLFLSNSPR